MFVCFFQCYGHFQFFRLFLYVFPLILEFPLYLYLYQDGIPQGPWAFFFFNHRFFFLLVKLDISRDFPLRFVDACLLNSLSSEFSSFVYWTFQPKNLQWIAFCNFRLWWFCIWWDTASHPLAQWSPNESSTIYVSVLTTETSRLCRRAVVLGHAFSTQQGTLQPLLPAGTCGPGRGESAGPSQD